MPLVDLKDMLDYASHNDYAIASFPVSSLESVYSVIHTAEELQAPVILRIRETAGIDNLLEMLVVAAEHAAQKANVPLGLHFEHISNTETAVSAIRMGCNSIGINTLTRETVEMAHSCGVPVEGQISPTTMDEVQKYTEHSGVDFFSIAITVNKNGLINETDLQHLAQIKQAIPTPFGITVADELIDAQLQELLDTGAASIHFSDRIEMRSVLVAEKTRLLGSSGRASELLHHCRKWNPIEHVIIFNVSAETAIDIEQALTQGRQVLRQIPGVRYVYTGQAVQAKAAYQFCWLVRFVHAAVIDSYREHPIHKKFADEIFRPIAPERISIDFEVNALP